MKASETGKVESVTMLLDGGAQVNAQNKVSGGLTLSPLCRGHRENGMCAKCLGYWEFGMIIDCGK